jgi:hypothetical protein
MIIKEDVLSIRLHCKKYSRCVEIGFGSKETLSLVGRHGTNKAHRVVGQATTVSTPPCRLGYAFTRATVLDCEAETGLYCVGAS